VAIVGAGNVALDIARILALDTEVMLLTDMPPEVVAALEECHVFEIHVLARRSPENAKFTPKELGEIGQLHRVNVVVHLPEGSIGCSEAVSAAVGANLGILRQWTKRAPEGGAGRRIHFHFSLTPLWASTARAVTSLASHASRRCPSPAPPAGLLTRCRSQHTW
jgi:ferredoxin/flavodoxin---NADP+ reductase